MQQQTTSSSSGVVPLIDDLPPARPTSAAPVRRRRIRRSPVLLVLAAAVVFNLIYALPRYLQFNPKLSRVPLDPAFPLQFPVLVLHVVVGNIALVTLFIQLVPWVRRRFPVVHRISGRLYVFAGALPASVLALVLLPFSTQPEDNLGLATMAVLWVITALLGLRAARRRDYLEHRRWMYYSFALALGTSWGRVLLLFLTPGVSIPAWVFFDISSWLGWVFSLVVVYWYVEWSTPRARRKLAAAKAG